MSSVIMATKLDVVHCLIKAYSFRHTLCIGPSVTGFFPLFLDFILSARKNSDILLTNTLRWISYFRFVIQGYTP